MRLRPVGILLAVDGRELYVLPAWITMSISG